MASILHFPSREAIITYLEQHPNINQDGDTYLKDNHIIEAVADFFADQDKAPLGVNIGVNMVMTDIGERLNLNIAGIVTIGMNLTKALKDCANGKKFELEKKEPGTSNTSKRKKTQEPNATKRKEIRESNTSKRKKTSEVSSSTISNGSTMSKLIEIYENSFVAFYDLVMKCRDDSFRFVKAPPPAGDSAKILKDIGLLEQDGTVNEAVKKLVLSKVKGNGLDLKLATA